MDSSNGPVHPSCVRIVQYYKIPEKSVSTFTLYGALRVLRRIKKLLRIILYFSRIGNLLGSIGPNRAMA